MNGLIINWQAMALRAVVAMAAVALVGFMVISGSRAAFSDTTTNAGNTFSTGTVVIDDDDANGAMFTATALKPNDTVTKCIEVTYTGSLTSNVRLYAANLTSTSGPAPNLDAYLDLKIERGTGGDFADCTGFSATETVFDGTNPVASDGELGTFASTYTNFANGGSTWNNVTTNDAQTFQFTATLQNDNAAQAEDATVDFIWEAQNT